MNTIEQRVSAVIVEGDSILLIHRKKPDTEYYVLPGGKVEEGENIHDAMRREIQEELSVDSNIGQLLLEVESEGRKDFYFSIKEYDGTPQLGGPELERISPENQYHLEWISKDSFKNLSNFYPNPQNAQAKLCMMWESNEL